MKITSIAIALSIALLSIISCKKNTDVANTADHFSSLDEFYTENGVPVQSFTISADAGGKITGSSGTVITFPAKCFVTMTGSVVTGNVTVDLREIYTEKDMVLSNMPTNSDQNSLRSAGEYNVKACQDGQPVIVAINKPYKVKFSSPFTTRMAGYIDTSNTKANWLAAAGIDSVESDTTWATPYYIRVYDSASTYFAYSDWTGWCNSDCSCNNGEDSINCSINNLSDFSSYAVYFSFNNNNSICIVDDETDNVLYWDHAPAQSSGFMVALGLKKDNSFCCAVVPYDLSVQHDYSVTLNPSTSKEFGILLDQLH